LQEIRSSVKRTKNIPAKFPELPLAVRAHLEMVANLLSRADAALVELVQDREDALHTFTLCDGPMLSRCLLEAQDELDVVGIESMAIGVLAGLRRSKVINDTEHDQLGQQFEDEAKARRAALNEAVTDVVE
jgi:hypothetical protein